MDYSPKPEPSREKYAGLLEACIEINDHVGNPSVISMQDAAEDIAAADHPEVIDPNEAGKETLSIIPYLKSLGFRKFAPLACSTGTVALETTQGQVLTFHETDRRGIAREPAIEAIQPITEFLHPPFTISIFPKLNSNVSEEHGEQFQRHLAAKNTDSKLQSADLKRESGDLGYLPDGTVVGIDADAVRYKNDASNANDQPWLIASDQPSIFPSLKGTGFISKQEHFYPALVDHRPRGVLSDQDIARLNAGELETLRMEKPECLKGVTPANLKEFTGLVYDEGWYPSQAHEIMQERGTITDQPNVVTTVRGLEPKTVRGRDGRLP